MAHVGEGTTHKGQVDELDAEIAEIEAVMKGESQQPQTEQVEPDQPPVQAEGDGMVEAITSVDEFIQHDQQPTEEEAPGQEQPEVAPQTEAVPVDEQPEQTEVVPKPTGRRSWKNDYLELENRYTKLRQASDHHKFETKQQLATLQEGLLKSQEENELLKNQLLELQNASQRQNVASAFTPEDIDVLGEGTVNSFQKAINQAVESATKPLQMELLSMKKAERDRLRQQAQTNRSQAYQTFSQRLAELVPDYPSINVDPEFVKWLKQPSPYGGAPRINFLHQAEAAGDVERVAQFFMEYTALVSQPQELLEQSVTPTGQGGGGAAPNTATAQKPGKKMFTAQFIDQFYNDDIQGKYKGRERLREQLDREIDLAIQEGRVV